MPTVLTAALPRQPLTTGISTGIKRNYIKKQSNIREKALKDLFFHLQYKLPMGSFLPQQEEAANI